MTRNKINETFEDADVLNIICEKSDDVTVVCTLLKNGKFSITASCGNFSMTRSGLYHPSMLDESTSLIQNDLFGCVRHIDGSETSLTSHLFQKKSIKLNHNE